MTVVVCDVAARDGLQNENAVLPPSTRAELVRRLVAAGLRKMEVASFVNPKRVPQMAGAEEVAELLTNKMGVSYAGLVLNARGYERFAVTDLHELRFTLAVSETFNQSNSNATVEESLADLASAFAGAERKRVRRVVSIATAFGCPFEGRVDEGRVISVAERAVEAGADEISLADTIGIAVPSQIRRLIRRASRLDKPIGIHLHSTPTRDIGYKNALAALEEDVAVIDASVGGVGGCPFAPRATGNIATEYVLRLLHHEGAETGIDLDAVIEVAEWLGKLLDRPLNRNSSAAQATSV